MSPPLATPGFCPSPGRTARVAGCLLLALLAAGCAAQQGPTVPDFDELRRGTRRRIDASRGLIERGQNRTATLKRIRDDLVELPDELDRAVFPYRLFKHVAMDCLSTPRADTRDEDQRSGPFELGCQPRHATRLDRSIEQRAPSLRPAAATTLQRLDHFRQSRADLRSILVEARDRVRDNRKFLADARADFERRRKELKARRAEFPVQQWRTLRERMRTERKRLAELEAISKRLAERSKEWPKKLAELNHAMYFAITSGWD